MPSAAITSNASQALSDAIRDGSFVDSEPLLSSDLAAAAVPPLLDELARSKESLSQEIQQSSRALGPGVDDWIAKAKTLQHDVAKCKDDAQGIVQDHQSIESLRSHTVDLSHKISLLEAEIDFTIRLESQLQAVSHIAEALQHIESQLATQQAPSAANALRELHSSISHLRGSKVRSIIDDLTAKLQAQAKDQLHDALLNAFVIERDSQHCTVEIKERTTEQSEQSLPSLLQGLRDIDAATEVLDSLALKLEPVLLRPLRRPPRPTLSQFSSAAHRFELSLGAQAAPVRVIVDFLIAFWTFFESELPNAVTESLAAHLLPKAIEIVIVNWMTPAIPVYIHDLDALDELKTNAAELLSYLNKHAWPGATKLSKWIDDAPSFWLAKRKAETLDAVRKAFLVSNGSLHQVERIERQPAPAAPAGETSKDASDDWDASWDESEPQTGDDAEDDTSGWGFDDGEQATSVKARQNGTDRPTASKGGETGEEADAWGWGDEDEAEKTDAPASSQTPKAPKHGDAADEIRLVEYYSITDIPDHLIDIIGRDIQDSLSLAQDQHPSLQSIPAAKGLLALPVLALAMFRATAPTHYANSPLLGNMNLYNDASYLTEKLRAIEVPENMRSIEPDCQTMDKFARSAYAREMELQKTILNDILDGAQGFTACTQPLYAREIENAVSATVDRVKQVYEEWKPILSTSALLQSVGVLLGLVINKFVSDIEEMDEISAPQSEKLVSFASHIATLGDLFVARPPEAASGEGSSSSAAEEQSVPMAAVYVPDWLRFQYLINILDSSLVDINFLWTEGELSLEFSADEVVDLIKALFQDSSHRKKAIAAIRGAPLPRQGL